MSLPDAAEAQRISKQLDELVQQRAQGHLPHDDAPLRLYRVRTGGLVRVLDRHPEPISPDMLEAIDAFIRKSEKKEGGEEEKQDAEQKNEVVTAEQQEQPLDAAEKHETSRDDGVLRSDTSIKDVVPVGGAEAENVSSVDTKVNRGSGDVEMTSPWEKAGSIKTPKELLDQNKQASSWLTTGPVQEEVRNSQETVMTQVAGGSGVAVETASPEVGHPNLYGQWPPQLVERRRILFVPPVSNRRRVSTNGDGPLLQPVVYWMRNTLRVTQGNFGLEAAILLSRRLASPLVIVCLVPSAIIYPICHATSATDAYARYSYVELYEQFKHAGVPFFGITAKEDSLALRSTDPENYGLKPNPLFELFDVFAPHAVVTDAAFDSPGRNDTLRLARYLELNRSSCSWSFLTMDSTTCCPAYQLSLKLQSTFESGATLASEELFGKEYTSFAQPRNGTYVFSSLPRASDDVLVYQKKRAEEVSSVLQHLCLEEINWQVVKGENSQSSSQMRRFSEAEGLQKLSQLLSDSSSQPAIQAELQGGGVLSLLPFIRHGTLFVGYVLQRISDAIASSPTPSSPQERKALAMRKVMRSRAVNHLAKERDYALYLALWASIQDDHDVTASRTNISDISQLSISETLSCLRSSVPRSSSLEIYRHLVPGWAFSLACLDDNNTGRDISSAALYDPYELESARTKDLYWNDIQKFLIDNQYLHPLLLMHWGYRVFTWSVSCRAAIAMVEALLNQCVLGAKNSPDAVIIVWKHLFRLGIQPKTAGNTNHDIKTLDLDEMRSFQYRLEVELKSQPKLKLRS